VKLDLQYADIQQAASNNRREFTGCFGLHIGKPERNCFINWHSIWQHVYGAENTFAPASMQDNIIS
jgi:hypothetical protein